MKRWLRERWAKVQTFLTQPENTIPLSVFCVLQALTILVKENGVFAMTLEEEFLFLEVGGVLLVLRWTFKVFAWIGFKLKILEWLFNWRLNVMERSTLARVSIFSRIFDAPSRWLLWPVWYYQRKRVESLWFQGFYKKNENSSDWKVWLKLLF